MGSDWLLLGNFANCEVRREDHTTWCRAAEKMVPSLSNFWLYQPSNGRRKIPFDTVT